jgi:hypothetical protein
LLSNYLPFYQERENVNKLQKLIAERPLARNGWRGELPPKLVVKLTNILPLIRIKINLIQVYVVFLE